MAGSFEDYLAQHGISGLSAPLRAIHKIVQASGLPSIAWGRPRSWPSIFDRNCQGGSAQKALVESARIMCYVSNDYWRTQCSCRFG